MIKPIFNRVLVEALEPESMTLGGILVPTVAQEQPQKGKVMAVGDGKNAEGKIVDMTVQVGDLVIFAKYSGSEFIEDGKKMLIMRESDIFAIIEE